MKSHETYFAQARNYFLFSFILFFLLIYTEACEKESLDKTQLTEVMTIVVMALLSLSACSKDRDNRENNTLSYQATELPDDIHKLYDARGDSAADTCREGLEKVLSNEPYLIPDSIREE